ncbi:monovalent cation/H+ antiporter subunit D family protein [Parvibaculum sp.]|uniref:monovalent cation/H+ antiporter subunit D family protein n=1 Tax=Parvibaculum sp. TaxID=2024848 RepID=UPI001B2F7516|nr:monovalent cation/H+ antiporter subunit D family protein [Parvibaculum sp.]MBO6669185.1 monovalent cation/H+ antiporter subunit D family protein [Parvibaculum sp.]MBO6692460.1 monovalent cation/H+ antiporter subunit D family protein [Parvibaculum sp.]MBO6713049.1 monovalent cation/H+ antiporter subunit D family protein [Parvibaculum sp.]
MTDANALLLALAIPTVTMFLIAASGSRPNIRDGISVAASVATFAVVLRLLESVMDGARPSVTLIEVMPGLVINFAIEPLGMLFATVASGLWIVTAIYSIGYMRGAHEKKQTRFYICFALAIASALAIAFSGNLFTLFIFYEVLTISTYPLVAHKETPEARSGARVYLGILMTTSILFLLVAVIWTWNIAGTMEFRAGGILEGKVDPAYVPFLLALFAFGIGKAALMPFHRWLPAAMVAPTPVSALLHAVAVVKAGVFTMLKVGTYIFGVGFLSKTGASDWLMWIAAASILIASIVALTKDDLKARLAYSTVSQLSYITLGMALANQMGVIGGSMHIVTHAVGKITLFMCAGAIYVAAHKTKVSELDGLGRKMPVTFICFTIAALSIIGLPPFAGAWSKWYLLLAAADEGQMAMIAVLMLSSLLNVAYLLSISGRAFFAPARDRMAHSLGAAAAPSKGIEEAPLFCLIPICLTALGCVVVFFAVGGLYEYLLSIPILPEAAP